MIRKSLEAEFGEDLTDRKLLIREQVSRRSPGSARKRPAPPRCQADASAGRLV